MTEDDHVLLRVRTAVETFVLRRTEVDVEDVVQEAMTRLLENQERLESETWASYAVVTAGNLLRDRERAGEVHRRHAHRLHAPDVSPSAEDHVLTAEEHAALRRAMASIDETDAGLLVEHHGQPHRSNRSISPATAARLARARAKLRVAYVLQHARVTPPTPRCRPVLEAVSMGDRRRQERLGSGRHLLACLTCATYAPALVDRQRAMAAVNPLAWVAVAAGTVWSGLRSRPVPSAAAGAVLTAVAVSVVLVPPDPEPPAAPPPVAAQPSQPATGPLVIDGRSVLPRRGEVPTGAATATDVPVQSVPADEGFWVGTGEGQRFWVELVGEGESPVQIEVGDLVSFTGSTTPTDPGYPDRVGLTREPDRTELTQMGTHVIVRSEDLVLQGS